MPGINKVSTRARAEVRVHYCGSSSPVHAAAGQQDVKAHIAALERAGLGAPQAKQGRLDPTVWICVLASIRSGAVLFTRNGSPDPTFSGLREVGEVPARPQI